jgi:hypothetical protein
MNNEQCPVIRARQDHENNARRFWSDDALVHPKTKVITEREIQEDAISDYWGLETSENVQ